MSRRLPLHYWDSCTFINLIQGQDPDNNGALKNLIEHIKRGELLIATSSLTLAEVVKPQRTTSRLTAADSNKIRDLFRLSSIRIFELTIPVAERAREIQWHLTVKPADAIHVATAESAKVLRFESFDDVLLGHLNAAPSSLWTHCPRFGHPVPLTGQLSIPTK